ncbi:MAG: hypothetical protein ABI622_03995 [Chloroflexota bacterium]
MAAERQRPAAVGRLGADPGSPWVGFVHDGDAFCLAFAGAGADGSPSLVRRTPRVELLALAIAYVTEALPDPPPELEATHADLADLLRWLRDSASPERAALLAEALDAVDDGLAEDVVVHRLVKAARAEGRGTADEQVDDWVGLLVRRYRSVSGG